MFLSYLFWFQSLKGPNSSSFCKINTETIASRWTNKWLISSFEKRITFSTNLSKTNYSIKQIEYCQAATFIFLDWWSDIYLVLLVGAANLTRVPEATNAWMFGREGGIFSTKHQAASLFVFGEFCWHYVCISRNWPLRAWCLKKLDVNIQSKVSHVFYLETIMTVFIARTKYIRTKRTEIQVNSKYFYQGKFA